MIIPPNEILNDALHYHFKAEANIALEYQINKTVFFCKKLEELLDKPRETHYLSEIESSYYLDSIINNHSTLIEYYYAWIILSLIGTSESAVKTIYRPIKEKDIDEEIVKIFKAHSIGVLKKTNGNHEKYYEKCRNTFKDAFEFLLVGECHELYVLNNYLKHNRMPFGYAPITKVKGELISAPFLYIHNESSILLQNSIIKGIFKSEHEKPVNNHQRYFNEIIERNQEEIANIGAIKVFKVNKLEYVHSNSFSGILLESILSTAYDLIKNIIRVQRNYDKGNITLMSKLDKIEKMIMEREPKTLSSL
ncbi:TPA: hypothetical protein ACGQGH_004526 [Escherichia coli]|uniref:hypothetical protein n=1 Tax=Enterobacteriaceae TaxID=543 RepID=UPI000DA52FB9|nr:MULTISPECIES: hypothetical protein [Enterobacteriaceae]MDK1301765.1 hypothetical protein [Cronobacter sakazakii]HDY8739715.1 hypothetical protein [Klebsiella pneumoniae]EFH2748663.1 hypothetical protein [Escherichia coli]EFH3072405.1 hypothetical protein [Escherichia coli]EFH4462640.1 hypothetical protein [Escherichia coli]